MPDNRTKKKKEPEPKPKPKNKDKDKDKGGTDDAKEVRKIFPNGVPTLTGNPKKDRQAIIDATGIRGGDLVKNQKQFEDAILFIQKRVDEANSGKFGRGGGSSLATWTPLLDATIGLLDETNAKIDKKKKAEPVPEPVAAPVEAPVAPVEEGETDAERAARQAAELEAALANPGVKDYGLPEDINDEAYKEAPVLVGDSYAAKAKADPAAVAAQQRAMEELFKVYEQGGLTAQDRARMAATRADQDQYLRSQREAHMQDLDERGMAGSGAEIAAMLGANQAAGQRMSSADLETEAMAQKRAMDALLGGADLAGGIRESSFNEAFKTGGAQDDVNLVNADILNGANTSDVKYKREIKAKLIEQKFKQYTDAIANGMSVAEAMMIFDQGENQTEYTEAAKVAGDTADKRTAATTDVRNYVTGTYGQAGDDFKYRTQGEDEINEDEDLVLNGQNKKTAGATGVVKGGASAGTAVVTGGVPAF